MANTLLPKPPESGQHLPLARYGKTSSEQDWAGHPSQGGVAPGGRLTGWLFLVRVTVWTNAPLARRSGRLGQTPVRLSESLTSTCEPSSATTSGRLAASTIRPRSSHQPPPHRHIQAVSGLLANEGRGRQDDPI